MSPLKQKPNTPKKSDGKPQSKKESHPTKSHPSQSKPDQKTAPTTRSDVTVKLGKPVMQVTFKRIKFFVTIFVVMFLLMIVLSFDLLITAVQIRSHLGSFINMISSGDGEVLPSLLAVPVFLFLCLNIAVFFFVYKIFSKKKNPGANKMLFISILGAVAMVSYGC